ncbi:MAG: hypothetical protein ABJO36_11680 [Litorimonas sp.]
MISQAKNLITGLSRLTLMGSVALPSFATAVIGVGAVSAPLFIAQPAEAAVIIGDRNRIKERPRRNYKSKVRIDRYLLDASGEVSVTGVVRFFAPGGTEGPVRDLNLEPAEMSNLGMENPVFVSAAGAMNNILSASVSGGACDGSEINVEVPFESKAPVDFTLCETETGTITGTARFTNKGKPRVNLTVPSDKAVRSDLYGMILIKGEPLEMERTVYTGDVNDVEPGAVAGYTYEQTITVNDAFGNTLDSQTVRGIVGEDDVDVMGPAQVIIGDRNKLKEKPRRNYRSVSVTRDEGPWSNRIFRIDGDFVYRYAGGGDDTAPDIANTTLSNPARVNAAFTYGEGPDAGGTLSGGFCGGAFTLPIGGVEADSTDIIDDMGGTVISGTELKARAHKRLDGTLRLNIKGDYTAIENCETGSLFAENTSGAPIDSFVNYIWEGEIDADPRTFGGITYERTSTLTDDNGVVLDRFIDFVTFEPPAPVSNAPRGYANRIRSRKYKEKSGTGTVNPYGVSTASTGPATGETRNLEQRFILGNLYNEFNGNVEGNVVAEQIATLPSRSVYRYEFAPTGTGSVTPEPWCGLTFNEPLLMNEDTALGDEGVAATLTEAGNGNYRVKIVDPNGSDDAIMCLTNHLRVNGVDSYDLGATHTWEADFPGLYDDISPDAPLFLQTTLVDSQTQEVLSNDISRVTLDDAPVQVPQLSTVELITRYDRGVQAVFDRRIVAEGLPHDKPFELTSRVEAYQDEVTADGTQAKVCHMFSNANVTFADPESVVESEYLVELTVSNPEGDDFDYMEFDIVGEERSSENTGSTVSGNSLNGTARLIQNPDGETFELAVGLCGAPQILSQAAVFMTPQDGGSEVDPEDFTLEFVDKLAFLTSSNDMTVESGSSFFSETLLTIDNEAVDVCATSRAQSEPDVRYSNRGGGTLTVNVCHLKEAPDYGSDGVNTVSEEIRRKMGAL